MPTNNDSENTSGAGQPAPVSHKITEDTVVNFPVTLRDLERIASLIEDYGTSPQHKLRELHIVQDNMPDDLPEEVRTMLSNKLKKEIAHLEGKVSKVRTWSLKLQAQIAEIVENPKVHERVSFDLSALN